MTENPNEYDDAKYTRTSVELSSAVAAVWESGVDLDNIGAVIEDGLSDAGITVAVDILEI